MNDIPLTPSQIDAALDRAVAYRKIASEAEADHFRRMHQAGEMVEEYDQAVDDLLVDRASWRNAMDPIDPEDPATVAFIAEAWAGFAPEPANQDFARAQRAVAWLASLVPVRGGVQELPALIQDEHGCWITDRDDPVSAQYPDVAMGCEVAW